MCNTQSLAGKKGSVVREISREDVAAASSELSLVRRMSSIRSQFAEMAPKSAGTWSSGKESVETA